VALLASSPELHGNPNVLTADVPTSRLAQVTTAQSVLVQIERVASAPHRDPHAPPAFVDAATDGRGAVFSRA
jgi:biotin/methionine sulfoxide reductase